MRRGDQASQNQAPGAAVTTIHTTTQLVVVDVTVTDGNGNPVHGLPGSSFSMLEDGKPQSVNNFVEHRTADVPVTPPVKLPVGQFTNFAVVPPDAPLNILLLDRLNTPLRDQMYSRQQVESFISQLQPGTRVAIFVLTSRLTMLQGFTSDPLVLRTALGTKAASP